MHEHVRGIDHVVVLVRDLDAARDVWQRMGFALTPRGHHTLGSQNHCLMFGSDYVELMAVPRPHPALQSFSDFLARGEGVGAIAFATDDAQGAQRELQGAGVAASAPLDFARPVATADGQRDARFRIVQLPDDATPGPHAFLCEHFTRDLVWRDDAQRHPIGVTGIARVIVRAPDPAAAAARWAQTLATDSQPADDGIVVRTGSAPLVFADALQLARVLPGIGLAAHSPVQVVALRLRVFDRSLAANALAAGGVAFTRLTDGALAIGADHANGVALVLE